MRNGPKTIRTGLVLIVMVITVMLLYYHMVNKVKSREPVDTTTVAQDLLLRNLDTNYPATPREVLRYYNEILQCYYAQEYSDEELEGLARKAFSLYDQELAANQDYDNYLLHLKSDIRKYKESDTVISSAALCSSTDVVYYTYKGRECANVRCVYTIREKTSLAAVKEIYVLRRDEDGHYRILGWDTDPEETSE